jgi:hypothetical protein
MVRKLDMGARTPYLLHAMLTEEITITAQKDVNSGIGMYQHKYQFWYGHNTILPLNTRCLHRTFNSFPTHHVYHRQSNLIPLFSNLCSFGRMYAFSNLSPFSRCLASTLDTTK